MDKVYVGLDLGSSTFQQAAIKTDGSVRVNRSFTTSEANLPNTCDGRRIPLCGAQTTAKPRMRICLIAKSGRPTAEMTWGETATKPAEV